MTTMWNYTFKSVWIQQYGESSLCATWTLISQVPVFPNRAARSLAGVNILCYNKISATGRIRLFSASMKASMKTVAKIYFLILTILKWWQTVATARSPPFFESLLFFFFLDQKSVWNNEASGQ